MVINQKKGPFTLLQLLGLIMVFVKLFVRNILWAITAEPVVVTRAERKH